MSEIVVTKAEEPDVEYVPVPLFKFVVVKGRGKVLMQKVLRRIKSTPENGQWTWWEVEGQ